MSGLDPGGVDPSAASSDRPLVLLGASYLASWPLREVGGRRVVNRGVAGQQTPAYLERFQQDVIDLHAQAVVIWGIDNDIIRAPDGRADEACARVERNLAALVGLARAHGIEPILVTDLTLRPPSRWLEWLAALAGWIRGREGYQQRINRHVLRVNAFVRTFAAEHGVRFLDLQPLVSKRNGMRARRYAKRDGSHLTDAGYRAINACAIPLLAAWLAAPLPARPVQPTAGTSPAPSSAPRVRASSA